MTFARLSKPLLEMVNLPGKGLRAGKFEVSYALWKKVYDWAVAHGYSFDHDGDMGSMDYWGMRDGWGAVPGRTGIRGGFLFGEA